MVYQLWKVERLVELNSLFQMILEMGILKEGKEKKL